MMRNMVTRDLVTVAQAGTLLGESRSKIERRLELGQLSFDKIDTPRGARLLKRVEVVALAEQLAAERRQTNEALEAKLEEAKAAMTSAPEPESVPS